MLVLLQTKADIAAAQSKLEATMADAFSERVKKTIGFPGGNVPNATVFTDGVHWYLAADHRQPETPNPRRLNLFGEFEPDRNLKITVEVNTAFSGRNDQIGGFFARDSETGLVYLLHSGRVGGGTKGVGKSAFLAWSDLELTDAVDANGEPRQGVIVMPVEGLGAVKPLERYIGQIAEFKKAARAGELESADFTRKLHALNDFYAEGRGRRYGSRSSRIDYLSRHGEVVDALFSWRQSQGLATGERLVKDVLIDLGLEDANGVLREVYEVKTSAARTNLYAGIGQLLVHGSERGCGRTLVLPLDEDLPTDVAAALERMGIRLLKFNLTESSATIVE